MIASATGAWLTNAANWLSVLSPNWNVTCQPFVFVLCFSGLFDIYNKGYPQLVQTSHPQYHCLCLLYVQLDIVYKHHIVGAHYCLSKP